MKTRWVLWIAFAALLLFVYLTRAVLLPFVAGLAVAYLLDPLADKLEEWKFPRGAAAAVILVLFFIGILGFIIALMPLVQAQVAGFVNALPGYVASLKPVIENLLETAETKFQIGQGQNADSLIAAGVEEGLARLGTMLGSFISGGLAVFNLLTLLLITPVVAFFLLRDWDLLVAKLKSWVPQQQKAVVVEQLHNIDRALSGFVRGQTLVAAIMGTLYAIGWTALGLQYGLILGLVAGVMAYIPFVGTLFAALIAILVAFGQHGPDFVQIGLVASVFVVVQILESAVLTPRLIGSRVGLHPVWVLFAIFAGGEVMGFVGVLIAVPAAAAIAVLVRFSIDRYLQSPLHLGPVKKKANQ